MGGKREEEGNIAIYSFNVNDHKRGLHVKSLAGFFVVFFFSFFFFFFLSFFFLVFSSSEF